MTVKFEETFEFTMFISSETSLNYSEFYNLLAAKSYLASFGGKSDLNKHEVIYHRYLSYYCK